MQKQTGLIHLYYGDGKGKTTAAFGLAFRCAGRGQPVVIAQFLKSGKSGELTAAACLPEFTLLAGKPVGKFTFQMDEAERAITAQSCDTLFSQATAAASSARLLVLDEVVDACTKGFLQMDTLVSFLRHKPAVLEVVLTGHSLPPPLERLADYISHVVKEKHPFDQGINARRDIEF